MIRKGKGPLRLFISFLVDSSKDFLLSFNRERNADLWLVTWPSGKAGDCKSPIPSSNLGVAYSLFYIEYLPLLVLGWQHEKVENRDTVNPLSDPIRHALLIGGLPIPYTTKPSGQGTQNILPWIRIRVPPPYVRVNSK